MTNTPASQMNNAQEIDGSGVWKDALISFPNGKSWAALHEQSTAVTTRNYLWHWTTDETNRINLYYIVDELDTSVRVGRVPDSIQAEEEVQAQGRLALLDEQLANESGYDEEVWPRLKVSLRTVINAVAASIIRQASRLLDVSGSLAMRGAHDHDEAAARAMVAAWQSVGGELRRQVDAMRTRVDPEARETRFAELAIKLDRSREEWDELIDLVLRLYPGDSLKVTAVEVGRHASDQLDANALRRMWERIQEERAAPAIFVRSKADGRRWDRDLSRRLKREKAASVVPRINKHV